MAQGARALGMTRLRGRRSTTAIVLAALSAFSETSGAVVAGRLAGGHATWALVGLLALLLVGAAVLDTTASTVASRAIGLAEGRLRIDLVHRALNQPIPVLQEQAVGELIDRVDDDVNQAGSLLRTNGWELVRAAMRTSAAWIIAGLTWWGAWIAFPIVTALALAVAAKDARVVGGRKLVEEAAWSDHAAQLEEAVAGRDDVRSSLGQAYVVRQYAARSREVLKRVRSTANASSRVVLRSGLVLHAQLAALVIGGVALVDHGSLSRASLVTVWLLTSAFTGQLNQVAHHVPELQAGIGALTRIGLLLDADQEPTGGLPIPDGPVEVHFADLHFAYPEGDFALAGVDLRIAAGTTCALVGRTGSGKSTLGALLSRAIEPPRGGVFLAGRDVCDVSLGDLRRRVGVVTQRTEILAATLLENVTLFAPVTREQVTAAFAALDLLDWLAALPDGLDTILAEGGVILSAGEEQLVAFARLLVRDTRVIVLDEATARMDPQTEAQVTRASQRLLAGRTGLVIAHRLATTDRCDSVAVLDAGRLVQFGARDELATVPGPFRELLVAAGPAPATQPLVTAAQRSAERAAADDAGEPSAPETRHAQPRRDPRVIEAPRPRLMSMVWRLTWLYPRWGAFGLLLFFFTAVFGAFGVVTGWQWGLVVSSLVDGRTPWVAASLLALQLLLAPLGLAGAIRIYSSWWVACALRLRLTIIRGQTAQRRLDPVAAGAVTARALDTDRLVRYTDRWIDVTTSVVIVAIAAALGRSWLVVAVLAGVLLLSAATSTLGAPLAGRAAQVAGDQRAIFGGSLASALGAIRTVKLAGATAPVERHLGEVDARRLDAHLHEWQVRSILTGIPGILVQVGVVAAWACFCAGRLNLATTLLIATGVAGFGWFGKTAAAVVTEAGVARRWLQAASELAGTADLITAPEGVDLVRGLAPLPEPLARTELRHLGLRHVTAVHEDGTVGVADVSFDVGRGAVVLLAGTVGSGKSSLLRALAGLVDHEGDVLWNDRPIEDPELFLRPGQVSYVSQVPRVLSGTFRDNVGLEHDRDVTGALSAARMQSDVGDAGGDLAVIGHRGVRLSGGQVQRLALARALATDAELLLADDVSSALDAKTELELWDSLRSRGVTVIGTSSKRSALTRADLVVILDGGHVVAVGTWAELAGRWGHLAA